MIYDRLAVTLLSVLATEREGTTNATIARYLLAHTNELRDITVRGVATACNVGVGSVSRFCRDAGFASFEDLRAALMGSGYSFEQAPKGHADLVCDALKQVEATIDRRLLGLLTDDLLSYKKVFTCGMLKAQAAAVDLQVDLLMLGKCAETCVSYAEQVERIAAAGRDELVVVFSYTGDYFFARDLSERLARLDRPRIWVVAGTRQAQPDFVYGCLPFASTHSQLTHPFQLEMAAALIAQEYARRRV